MGKHFIKSDEIIADRLRPLNGESTVSDRIEQSGPVELGEMDLTPLWKVEQLLNERSGADGIVVTKIGSDVDGDGNLDLSEVDLPLYPMLAVYVDDVVGVWQTQFNKSTNVLTGLYGIDPGAKIEIVIQ